MKIEPILKLSVQDAQLIYKDAGKDGKAKLEKLFSKEILERDPTKSFYEIKTLEDACIITGDNPMTILHKNPNEDQIVANAYTTLRIIAKALRGDWKPDYGNSSQPKWYCWFRWDKSGAGFVFDCSHTYYDPTNTFSGSRLCFPTEEMANYFGTQFLALHKVVLEAA